MQSTPTSGASLSGKITASAIVLALVVVGLIGLVVPIIPGFLFLAIAAVVAAKHFPSIDAQLRRHRVIGDHLDKARRAENLGLRAKIQLAALFAAKLLVGGVARIASSVTKLRTARY